MSEPTNVARENTLFTYTGHPFVDIGVAAITSFVGKRRPEELTAGDLVAVSRYIEQNYVRQPLRGYLTMAFTQNAWFAQNNYNPERPGLPAEKQAQRQTTRAEWARRHTQQWQTPQAFGDAGNEPLEQELCAFTGQRAIAISLSGRLALGRAGRAQIPLMLGDEAINFFANGYPGLPISGTALLALQFFPLACVRCGIGLLAIHSDNELLLYRITNELLARNLKDIVQVQMAQEEHLSTVRKVSVKTLLIETLLNVERQRGRAQEEQAPASITAYNFNNGKNLGLQLYYLPMEIVDFLRVVRTPTYVEMWDRIVQRGWRQTGSKSRTKGSKGQPSEQAGEQQTAGKESEEGRSYNTLYEDLFALPAGAARFIHTYFLRIPRGSDARGPREVLKERDTWGHHWLLVELFLAKVVRMDAERIAQIRTLGDGLATYVRRQGGGGKRFFRLFFTERNPALFRALLIKANIAHKRDGQPSLFDMDTYISVFEEGYEIMQPDWRLARDLVLMRMVDQLTDWLATNPDAIPQDVEDQNGQDSGKEAV